MNLQLILSLQHRCQLPQRQAIKKKGFSLAFHLLLWKVHIHTFLAGGGLRFLFGLER